MHWGVRIAILLGAYVCFMSFLAIRAVQESYDLVAPDYYQQEVQFQKRIDQALNAKNLEYKPKINVMGEKLNINFPESMAQKIHNGEVYLFRPSDAKLDRKFKLELNQGLQQLGLENFMPGNYDLKLSWEMEGKVYYIEERVYL